MPSLASVFGRSTATTPSNSPGGNVIEKVLEHCCLRPYDSRYEVGGVNKRLAQRILDRPVVFCLGSWLAMGGEIGHTIASLVFLNSKTEFTSWGLLEMEEDGQCLDVEAGRVSAISLAIAQAVLIGPAILCLLPYSCLASCCNGTVTQAGLVVQVLGTVLYWGMMGTLLGLAIWIEMSGCYEKTEGVEGMAIFAGITTLGLLLALAHSVAKKTELSESVDVYSGSA